ncbi:pyridoxal phosphate-dependent transferase [Aspergillus alliaceus]|uniref:sphinganine-1-phosphate aldolase n=1 Tax=Petromyces alliaceus TaxID=209559 RepID=A0A5N7CAQ6_PETAA|nr:pyridoxal phosphate-dependent transferase [Aspergillus alliaceus]
MSSQISQSLVQSRKLLVRALVALQNPVLSGVGAAACTLFVFQLLRQAFLQIWGHGPINATKRLYKAIRSQVYGWLLASPFLQRKVNSEVEKSVAQITAKFMAESAEMERYRTLPDNGWDDEEVLAELEKISSMEHVRWEDGRVSGAVYHGGKEMLELQNKAYSSFTVSNPIHPDVFPGVRKMEAEIISMVLALFNAPNDAAGATTSGGTESILAACLSARERGRVEKGIRKPEMIIPTTAHPAFRKAGNYFNIKIHEVDCPAPSYQVDVRTVSRLINRNTILLVGSAPNYPHGVIDGIADLSRIAESRNILLHVDCCLGSFMIAFLQKAGFETVPFDFRLAGVTSISCDTHKYGFAPKGTSVVMYRTKELRAYQYYISPDWSGGVYASHGIMGSRPGALLAGCWASMVKQGAAGYIQACQSIVGCRRSIEKSLRGPLLSAHLQVIGNPLVSVVAFTSPKLNILHIADEMTARGWHLNALQNPPAIHIAVTLPIVQAEDQLLSDLQDVVEAEAKMVESGEIERGTPGNSVALYGVAGSLPNKGVVVKLIRGYLDALYTV